LSRFPAKSDRAWKIHSDLSGNRRDAEVESRAPSLAKLKTVRMKNVAGPPLIFPLGRAPFTRQLPDQHFPALQFSTANHHGADELGNAQVLCCGGFSGWFADSAAEVWARTSPGPAEVKLIPIPSDVDLWREPRPVVYRSRPAHAAPLLGGGVGVPRLPPLSYAH